MWAELPQNERNEAPRNEHIYESDLLTFTTDVRMEKVPQIFASSRGHGEVSQSQGSGGGGPVEAVFWIREVQTQWRLRGHAYVVSTDIEGVEEESSGVRTVKSQVGERMRVIHDQGREDWSWQRELTAHFGNLSPGMRGSFKNPTPGQPSTTSMQNPDLKLGQKITDNHDQLARDNFRVVIIVPDEVEQIDLTDAVRARRWLFTYNGNSQEKWSQQELWP